MLHAMRRSLRPSTSFISMWSHAQLPSYRKQASLPSKKRKNEVIDMVKEYQRRRDYAVKAINEIDGLSCRCPKGAFYIFINIEKPRHEWTGICPVAS